MAAKIFYTSVSLPAHITVVISSFMSLISKGALDIRKRTVDEGRCDQCAMCNKEYDILGVLRYHKRTVHDGRNSYCDVCGKEYRSKENLRAHMRTFHHKMSFVA